jgi:hypothetical protein
MRGPTKVHGLLAGACLVAGFGLWLLSGNPVRRTGPDEALIAQRRALLSRMQRELRLTPQQRAQVQDILMASPVMGQGNPELTQHPMTRDECEQIRAQSVLHAPDPECSEPNMVRVYDPATGPASATLCIDQYEFPNIPCEYPVILARASEAARLCNAMGKRLCDAHEWEGACAGALRSPDVEYSWGHSREVMRAEHNREVEHVWAYGPEKNHARCATASHKTPGCTGGYDRCGSNTYPSGAFPGCVSRFGVYDQHGNVAEHMNLPMNPGQLASAKGHLGRTEMKGSWFIFDHFEAHEDDCRWRAPNWHDTDVMNPHSHRNYHLGFRCCLDLVGGSAD